jgi:hypothetical protein
VPAPVALAATGDPRRADLIGSLLAAECRRKDVDVLLAPTVNLQRSPFGGRNFEFFSEDPLLTAAMGGALVRGLQRCGVAATVKHFVANDSETQRFTVDARIGQRVLRELYLAPCTWRSLPETVRSRLAAVRIATTVRASTSGTHLIGCSGLGRFRLTLADEPAFNTYLSVPTGTDPTEAHIRPPQQSAAVSLEAGQSADVILEHDVGDLGHQTSFVLGGVSFQLNICEPHRPDAEEIDRAVLLAQAADVVVVVVGTTEEMD